MKGMPKRFMDVEEIKLNLGRVASSLIESGMRVGIGTGSTAIHVIDGIANLLEKGVLENIKLVPTSTQTQVACWERGLNLVTLNDPCIDGVIDIAIDGADEVDPDWNLIKGGGGALLNEKIVAASSVRYVIIIDDSKLVKRLGERGPIPVEIIPSSLVLVKKRLSALGFDPVLREGIKKQGAVITDNGNYLIDCWPKFDIKAEFLEQEIGAITGVVENGIFTKCVTDLLIGSKSGIEKKLKN